MGCSRSPQRPHSSSPQKQQLLSEEALIGSQCPLAREFTGWSLLHSPPHTPPQSICMLVSSLITALPSFQGCCHSGTSGYKHTDPTQHRQPDSQGASSAPLRPPPHQAGCLRDPHPAPITQLPPLGTLGQGLLVSTRTQGAAWVCPCP